MWTFEEMEKQEQKDEFGHFYYCPQTEDCDDTKCHGLNYIAPEWANGQIMTFYEVLRKAHLRMREERRLQKIHSEHKYTLERYLRGDGK